MRSISAGAPPISETLSLFVYLTRGTDGRLAFARSKCGGGYCLALIALDTVWTDPPPQCGARMDRLEQLLWVLVVARPAVIWID